MVRYIRPACPECGGVLGILVHYAKTKIHPLVPDDKRGEWTYNATRTIGTGTIIPDDAAETRFACAECDWADWANEHSRDLQIVQGAP